MRLPGREDLENVTPLILAAYGRQQKMVRLLLDAGANVNGVCGGVSALFRAVERGSKNVAKMLIEAGVNVHQRALGGAFRNDGRTVLISAVRRGDPSIMKLLLKHRIDANAIDTDGYTAFHVAAQIGDRMMIEMLVQAGANTRIQNIHGPTAREVVIKQGYQRTASLIGLYEERNHAMA